MVLFIGLYAVFMGAMLVLSLVNIPNTDAGAYIVSGLLFLLFAVLAGFGITNVVLNIKLGRALRSNLLPTQKRVIVTSIFNICSFLCGGVFVLPFGMALGIFGLVFATSDNGKAFLNGLPSPTALPPQPMQNFVVNGTTERDWR